AHYLWCCGSSSLAWLVGVCHLVSC
ncbi:hypothetical protein D046_5973B, partial [Vibrio parahaemolyticus V-223/04]